MVTWWIAGGRSTRVARRRPTKAHEKADITGPLRNGWRCTGRGAALLELAQAIDKTKHRFVAILHNVGARRYRRATETSTVRPSSVGAIPPIRQAMLNAPMSRSAATRPARASRAPHPSAIKDLWSLVDLCERP